jgi:hypothetical protein
MNRDNGKMRLSAAGMALGASCLLAAAFCVAAAAAMWPSIDGDGPAYFPAAVEWGRHHALANPVWLPPLNDSIDGVGGRRYVYHGFVYQLVVGAAGRHLGASPQGTVYAAYLIHWLTAACSAAAVLVWSRLVGVWRVLSAAVLPLAMLALSVAWHGRMEPLAMLIVAIAVLCWFYLPSPWKEGSAGAALALLTFTSPACGVLGGLAVSAAMFANQDSIRPRSLLALLIGGLVSTALILTWYPYPLRDWIGGVSRHARINLGLVAFQGFTPTWLTRPELPLLLVSFGGIAAGAATWLFDYARELRGRWLIWATALLFAVGLWRLAFVKSEASYNAVVWLPALATLALADSRSRWLPRVAVIGLLLPIAGLGRSTLQLASARRHTPSFGDLEERLAQVASDDLAVSSGLWLAASDLHRVHVTSIDKPERDIFVVQQAYTGRSIPPTYTGYRLVENRFGPAVTIMGFPISRTGGGWSYAVYKRESALALGPPPLPATTTDLARTRP